VQHALGLTEVGCLDVGAACAGFLTGVHLAAQAAVLSDYAQLVVAAEVRSCVLSAEEFSTACLFGDGAAACLLTRTPPRDRGAWKLLASRLFADGSVADLVSIPAGGSLLPSAQVDDKGLFALRMKDGGEVFLRAVEGMVEAAGVFQSECGRAGERAHWLVPHQANLRLVLEVGRRLGYEEDSIVQTIRSFGNTSGASVGMALAQLTLSGDLRPGQRALLIAAGGGGLAACALVEWQLGKGGDAASRF
jgi:3-oxoacyl-[acyl-carrier-protein] synthase III